MKQLNKQILEAIQKGINLAVDDFDSLDTIEVQKKSRILNDIHSIDFIPYVDLGLPSGTLWYKYNVGVDIDNLNSANDWYGNYYTFEEANSLKGYTMPTSELIQELIDETKFKWVENYNGIQGLNGRTFTGKNGKSIFIPATGYYSDSGNLLYFTGDYCLCWSSMLCSSAPRYGHGLYFSSFNVYLDVNNRNYCASARPVLNRKL